MYDCLYVWVFLLAFKDSGNGVMLHIPHLLLPNRTLIVFRQSHAHPAQVTIQDHTKSLVIPMPLFPASLAGRAGMWQSSSQWDRSGSVLRNFWEIFYFIIKWTLVLGKLSEWHCLFPFLPSFDIDVMSGPWQPLCDHEAAIHQGWWRGKVGDLFSWMALIESEVKPPLDILGCDLIKCGFFAWATVSQICYLSNIPNKRG